jgi:hypothetical protein
VFDSFGCFVFCFFFLPTSFHSIRIGKSIQHRASELNMSDEKGPSSDAKGTDKDTATDKDTDKDAGLEKETDVLHNFVQQT